MDHPNAETERGIPNFASNSPARFIAGLNRFLFTFCDHSSADARRQNEDFRAPFPPRREAVFSLSISGTVPFLGMRSDSLFTKLGVRKHDYRRLWLEDSHGRLTRNGFAPGTRLTVSPRLGPGLALRTCPTGSLTVSRRREHAILSYESRDLGLRFIEPEARVKVSVGLVQVLPSLRVFSIRAIANEEWTIAKAGILLTPKAPAIRLHTGRERAPGRPTTITWEVTESNLVAATDFIAWAKPPKVVVQMAPCADAEIQGDLFLPDLPVNPVAAKEQRVLSELARQFLVSCGFSETGPGVYCR